MCFKKIVKIMPIIFLLGIKSFLFTENNLKSAKLIIWFDFDEGGGDIVKDKINNIEGYLSNCKFVEGISKYGLQFNGINSKVKIPNSEILNFTSPFSVELWFKSKTVTGTKYLPYAAIIGKYTAEPPFGTGYDILIDKEGMIRACVRGNQRIDTDRRGINFLDNEWHHLVVIFTNTFVQIYVDGKMWGNVKGTWEPRTNQEPLYIGFRDVGVGYFDGVIDEFKIYDGVLTYEEILSKYEEFKEFQYLINPSFEGKFDEKGIAYGWADNSSWAPVKVIYSKETVEPLDGNSAQKIECVSFEGGAVQFVNTASIKAKKGKLYKLSVWMKGKVNSPVEIQLRQHEYPWKPLITKAFIVGDTWKEYTVEDVAPFDEEDCWFMIRFLSTGVLWVDKASFTEVKRTKYEKINLLPNLIDNGSFELGLNGWIYNIRESGGYKYQPKIEFLNIKPVIDNSTFIHGNKSLKISLPQNSSLTLTTSYYKINPDSEYTLSLWMKSEPPGMKVNFGVAGGYTGYGRNVQSITKEAILTNEWKKYDFNLTLPPIFENSYHILIQSSGPGILWIDGVVFSEKNNIKGENFIPKHPKEISLYPDREDNLYFEGEDIKIVLNCYIEEKIRNKEEIEYKILDIFGKEVENGKTTLNLSSNKYYEKPLITTKLPIGWYKIIAKLVGKEDIFDECLIGVLPKRETYTKYLNSPFGGHIRGNAYSLGIGEKMGVKWIRLHPPLFTKWMVVENKKGEFLWFDEIVKEINNHNMYILGSLDTTAQWASTHPEKGDGWVGSATCYPPKDLKDWENYVEAVLKHYKDIKYWEVWNEPDASFLKIYPDRVDPWEEKAKVYVSLLKSAYKVAKKIDPNIKIVGGVGCHLPPVKWVQLIAAEGAFDYMDILSLHIYDEYITYEKLKKYIDDIKNEMKKYGRIIPIWNTEAGIGESATSYNKIKEISPSVPTPPEKVCSYIIKSYVLNLSVGIEKFFYYSMFSSGLINRRECCSILECDGKPRPSLVTYSVLSWLLEGKKFVNRQTIGEAEIYEFKNGNEKILVVWSEKNKNIEIPVENKNVVVYNFIGGKEGYKKKGEKIEIVVDDFPKLIRIFE